MKYRKLDTNGDYVMGRGDQNYLSGAKAVAQAVNTKLMLLSGEWWEDLEDGLPLFDSILGVRGTGENKQTADILIQSSILSTPGVKSIPVYESGIDSTTREFSIKCTIETYFGPIETEVIL